MATVFLTQGCTDTPTHNPMAKGNIRSCCGEMLVHRRPGASFEIQEHGVLSDITSITDA